VEVPVRRVLLLPVLVLLVLLVPDLATASPSLPTERPYGWPLAGLPTVDRGFDPPRTAWGAGHRGVDLRAPLDAPVLAAGAGRVAYAGLLAGRGVVVVVHAGGLRTTYEPVAATAHVDDVVARGDVLGTLAQGHASCRSGVTCLHWGLLRGDTYLDPLSLLGPGRLRLLPLRPADRALLLTSATAGSAAVGSEQAAVPGGARRRPRHALRSPSPSGTGAGGLTDHAGPAGAVLAAGTWVLLRRRHA